MQKLYLKIGVWLSTLPMLLAPLMAAAGPADPGKYLKGANSVATGVGGTSAELPVIIGKLINVLISVLGIIFVVLIVYAGYMYMTAAGDDEKVKKAKKLIGQSVIGLIIILVAYSIANFVITQLTGITSP